MKKFRFLLFDANIVIELFRLGIWDQVVERCDIYLPRTVAEVEAQFYIDADDQRQYFDVMQYAQDDSITVFDLDISDMQMFSNQFDPVYVERLDPGELEALAYLENTTEEYLISSADSIVYRVLGNTNKAEQGISLEEILQQIGLGRALPNHFTKQWRERWTQQGFREQLQGIGRRRAT